MLVGLAQVNTVIGDFEGNLAKMLDFAAAAVGPAGAIARSGPQGKVDLLVFPELALCGYPPMDLLDQDSFAEGNLAALRRLQHGLPPQLSVAVGYVDRNRAGRGKPLVNAVALLRGGELVFAQAKTLLPTYDVFDEARYFEPARERRVTEIAGRRVGFAICEDIWWRNPPMPGLRYEVDPVKELLDAGAEILVVPSASPFASGILEVRTGLARRAATEAGIPVLYCNLLGANDSLVFDGGPSRSARRASWRPLPDGRRSSSSSIPTRSREDRLRSFPSPSLPINTTRSNAPSSWGSGTTCASAVSKGPVSVSREA